MALTTRPRRCPALWVVVVCSVFPAAHAGPFGLDMGMTKAQAGVGESSEDLGGYRFKIALVPRPHSAFEAYVLRITPKQGLCQLTAIGKTTDTNGYGEPIRTQFDQLEAALERRYGEHQRRDFLLDGSIWDEPSEWTVGLAKKERVLAAHFAASEGSTLTMGVTSATLGVVALSATQTHLTLEYVFDNHEACEDESDSMTRGTPQDSVHVF